MVEVVKRLLHVEMYVSVLRWFGHMDRLLKSVRKEVGPTK